MAIYTTRFGPTRPYLFDTKTLGYLRSWCEYHLSPRQRQGTKGISWRPDPNVIHLAMVERVICWSPKRTHCHKEGRLMSRKCGGFQFSESCQVFGITKETCNVFVKSFPEISSIFIAMALSKALSEWTWKCLLLTADSHDSRDTWLANHQVT